MSATSTHALNTPRPQLDLPAELWLEIATELTRITSQDSADHLDGSKSLDSLQHHRHDSFDPRRQRLSSRYMGINRHFFVIYMVGEYAEVHWTEVGGRMMAQLHALQNPATGLYVRSLVVSGRCIDSWMDAPTADLSTPDSVTNHGGLSSDAPRLKSRLHSKLLALLRKAPSAKVATVNPVDLSKESNTTADGLLQLMTSAVIHMHNLTSYKIEVEDMGLSRRARRFHRAVQTTLGFASLLRKLTLQCTIFKFKSIFDHEIVHFPRLEELDVRFDSHVNGIETQTDEVQRSVVPFIKSHSSSLLSLSLGSRTTVDLSHFFQAIGKFPSLTAFSADVCLDEEHLSDVTSFIDFLHHHSATLCHLGIRACIPDSSDNVCFERLEKRRQQSWLRVQRALVADVCETPGFVGNLESLRMPVGNVDWSTQLIQKAASRTLKHLSLTDHFLTGIELTRVLDALTAGGSRTTDLQSIHAEVKALSVREAVGAVATALPPLISMRILLANAAPGSLIIVSSHRRATIRGDVGHLVQLQSTNRWELDWNWTVKHVKVPPHDDRMLASTNIGNTRYGYVPRSA